MCKYLVIVLILVFSSCHKQVEYTDEKNEADIVSTTNDEISPQEDVIRPNVVFIKNEENFPLESIIGTWWTGTPTLLIEIEFTNNGVLNIKELNKWTDLFFEGFYPYKIEGNKIIIENVNKSNNFDVDINDLLLSPLLPDVYITNLDDRSLGFERFIESNSGGYLKFGLPFYKGTLEELSERSNIRLNYENKLKEFISNEVLNSIIYQGDINDENGVINTYGVPIKDEIIEYSDGQRYEGGLYLTGIREITYEDLIHRYYVFTGGVQYYIDVIINKRLDRLTSVNIGVTSEEVTAVFGNNYWRKEGEDIIYTLSDDHSSEPLRWVKFSIENNSIIKISYIITLWGK
jgi:hypothetical protein